MTAKIGTTDLVAAYIGTTPLTGLYVGTEKVWPVGPTTFTDNFNRANGALGANWEAVPTVVAPVISGNSAVAPTEDVDSAARVVGLTGPIQIVAGTFTLGNDYSEGGVLAHATAGGTTIGAIYTTDGTHPAFPGFGDIDGPAYQLYHLSGGGAHMIANVAAPNATATRRVLVACNGTALEAWFDGVRKLSGTDGGAVPRTSNPAFTVHQGDTLSAHCDDFSARVYAVAPPAPNITSFSPSSAVPGTTITVTGTDFQTECTQVTVHGVDVAVNVTSSNTGTFVVPAVSPLIGTATLLTPFGSDTDAFTVLALPPTFGATTEAVTESGTSLAVAAPPGINGAVDQRVYIVAFYAAFASGGSITPPAGFEAAGPLFTSTALSGYGITCYGRVYQSTVDHSAASTFTVGFAQESVASRVIAGIVNNTDGAAVPAWDDEFAVTTLAVPSVTTSVDGELVMAWGLCDNTGSLNGLSGFTAATVSGTDRSYFGMWSKIQATAGATPTPSFTVSGTTSAMWTMAGSWLPKGDAVEPGAPVLSAVPLDTKVALTWTTPSNGGSLITDYKIERSANGTSGWTTVTDGTSAATTYTVTGLTNGTIVYVRVSAINSVGTGPVSNVASATPAVFSPTNIANLATWYDASVSSSFTFSGSDVTQWRDISGSGNHLNPISANPARVNMLNGLFTVSIDDGEHLINTNPAVKLGTGNNLTIFYHFRKTGNQHGNESAPFTTSLGNQGHPFDYYDASWWCSGDNYYGGRHVADADWFETWSMVMAAPGPSHDNPGGGALTLKQWVNGDLTVSQSFSGWNWETDGHLTMGGRDDGATNFTGEIAEVLAYNRALTDSERQQVEAYLEKKWSTPLSMPGLVGWWDVADQFSAAFHSDPPTGAIAQIDDLSGNGHHLQSNSGTAPARDLTVNNLPMAQVGSPNDWLDAVFAAELTQPLTVAAVFRISDSSQAPSLYDNTSSGTSFGVWQSGTAATAYMEAGSTISGPLSSGGSPVVLLYSVYNGASSVFRINRNTVATGNIGSGAMRGLRVLANRDGIASVSGVAFGEAIVCSGVLSNTNRDALENYLRAKWGTP